MSEIRSSLNDSGIHRTRKRPITLSRMLESMLEAGRDILERRRADGQTGRRKAAARAARGAW